MMFRSLLFSLIIGLAIISQASLSTAYAAAPTQQRTVTLQVDNMTCSLCPITVRKALKQVNGVVEAQARYEGNGIGWAKITFDPSKTTAEALARAVTLAGYPARVKTD